ncbi:MAG TPA: VTT domain-containing protein [Methanoregulaceae archaeon]|nr:VTT domain-containing protein [Methanoregulaceae archaeon]
MLPGILDFFIHIDKALPTVSEQYGLLTYLILFTIILLETGVIITPFLPGDSLLFVSGMIAAEGSLDIQLLWVVFITAAICGGVLNYWTGRHLGLRVLLQHFPSIVRKEHVTRAYEYLARYGGKTIFFARFIPLLRTFTPFLAGVVAMDYRRFTLYNILSALIWAILMTSAGYLLGTIPVIQDNLSFFIMVFIVITIVSVVLFIVGIIRAVFWYDKNLAA